ncbi:phosphatase PAP2 family protein [Brevundimonas sp.]|uniref:phosphatase PAP2 family protein n=1 Tax=Brevundimonas sp. TaxID=1871086 RepID=UPI0028A96519|nr:phosphatase PAP2 family protein [Brevundimonas sp.]
MRTRGGFITVFAAGALLSACAGTPAALRPEAAKAVETKGYLTPSLIRTLADAMPPPPVAGSPVDLADKTRSNQFRTLEDSDRWLLATAHAELRPPLALQHFDCALGVRLGSATTPNLNRLMQRLFDDSDAAAELVKARGFRARPVGDDPARRSCQRVSEAGRKSASYPSGSSTVATVYGEAFAALEPGRAVEVRRIAHEMGLSRLVCGMHYPSDVAAGEVLGKAVFDAAAATPDFDADLAAARIELAAARSTGLTNPGCASERLALATPLP